ncbi:MAG: AEC family transporter [Candidatus Magasanikbacteria bacterium]
MTILQSILPIFLLIATGAILQKLLPAQPDSSKLMCKLGLGSCLSWTSVLNKFALYLALPAVIIHSLATTGGENIISSELILFNLAALIIFLLAVYLTVSLFNLPTNLVNTYLFGALLGNVAYIGPPFISSLYSNSSGTVSILIAIHILIAFSLGLYILEHNSRDEAKVKHILQSLCKNPLIIAVVLGIGLYLLQLQLPHSIERFLSMLADSASPIVLIAIGTFLVKNWSIEEGIKHGLAISALKLIIMPFVFLSALFFFPSSQNLSISILEAAMPVALTNFALSDMYEMDQYVMSSAIIISTIASAITLSVLAFLLV